MRVLGRGGGLAGLGFRGRLVSRVILFWFVEWRWRRSLAVDLMKVWPS